MPKNFRMKLEMGNGTTNPQTITVSNLVSFSPTKMCVFVKQASIETFSEYSYITINITPNNFNGTVNTSGSNLQVLAVLEPVSIENKRHFEIKQSGDDKRIINVGTLFVVTVIDSAGTTISSLELEASIELNIFFF
jgi:hypothetical protein